MQRSPILLAIFVAACEAGTLDLEALGVPDAGRECSQADPQITKGTLEGMVRWTYQPSIDASGGRVYRHHIQPDGTTQIVAFDPISTAEEAITDPGAEAYLMDASEGAALWIERFPGTAFQLFHRSPDGERRGLRTGETVDAVQIFDDYAGIDLARSQSDAAVWLGVDGVWRWDRGSEGRLIFPGEPSIQQPSIGEGRIVFAVHGAEGSRIMVQQTPDRRPEAFALGDVNWPVSSGDSVFYVDQGRLTRLHLASNEKTTLHEGPCGPPSADGGRVVAACGGDLWPAPGQFIAYWDSVQTHELFRDGGFHFAPRLAGGRIVWLRYPSTDALCAPSPEDAPGDVRWWDPDISAEPIVVGEVGAPCLCCDAFWPPAELAFDGAVAVWTYAIGDQRELGRLGWARVDRQEVCAPN